MYIHRCEIESLADGKAKVTGPCFVTGKPHSVICDQVGLFRYMGGYGKVQDCFPDMSTDNREFLISGTSPEGWKEMFGEEEDTNEEAETTTL